MKLRTALAGFVLSFAAATVAAAAAPRADSTFLASQVPDVHAGPRSQTYSVTVSSAPSNAVNAINPRLAIGGAVDTQYHGTIPQVFAPANIKALRSSGIGAASYRLYTELSVQDWHWNPNGTWSDPSGQGYWTGSTTLGSQIVATFGYALPSRGETNDSGDNLTYSVVDDGDPTTYWKSDPYLDTKYTGDPNTAHPQWVFIDLGSKKPVDAAKIAWSSPYATTYAVQYWTGTDPYYYPAGGTWKTFPSGSVTNGKGGTVTLRLASSPVSVQFVLVWMTASSNTCDSHGSSDSRNCVGYATEELGVGSLSGTTFHDVVVHRPSHRQSATLVSSTDPWHVPKNKITNAESQPGLDIFYTSGITSGMPATLPVSMLYGTPDDAAAEIRYVEARGYPIARVELGEEPDGQFVLPEDYAALYVQWAKAIHAVDSSLLIGGPVFTGVTSDVQAWRDSHGNLSWLNRFLSYLRSHGGLGQLSFMSFEHYPFNDCQSKNQDYNDLLNEPGLVRGIVQTWYGDGLPTTTPLYITELNFSASVSPIFQEIDGALWYADFAGSFLTSGGQGTFYYQYATNQLTNSRCGFGQFNLFKGNQDFTVNQPTAQYFAAQLVTQAWADPVSAKQTVYPAASNILTSKNRQIVTAYAVARPGGTWAVMLVNKDPSNSYNVNVTFNGGTKNSYFTSPVTMTTFGSAQYAWHVNGPNSYANPDGPAVTSSKPGGAGAVYTLGPSSITVLRAALEQTGR